MPIFVSRKALLLEQSPYSESTELEDATSALEEQGFTRDEAERLARYRVWSGDHGERAEQLKIERRLAFVRWLVEHDRIKH